MIANILYFTGIPKERPVAIDDSKNPLKDGPFGYIDKGTFFEDAPLNGQFPESIEVIYQVGISGHTLKVL